MRNFKLCFLLIFVLAFNTIVFADSIDFIDDQDYDIFLNECPVEIVESVDEMIEALNIKLNPNWGEVKDLVLHTEETPIDSTELEALGLDIDSNITYNLYEDELSVKIDDMEPNSILEFDDLYIDTIDDLYIDAINDDIIVTSDEAEYFLAAANLPDFTVSKLTAHRSFIGSNGNFRAYADAGFEFTITNLGGAGATNIPISILVNGSVIGEFYMNRLPAYGTYSGVLEISNAPAGNHTIQIAVNRNGSIQESNTNNNSLSKVFTWDDSVQTAPDIVTTIINEPPSYYIFGNQEIFYEFRVYNIGGVDITKPFNVEITIDGQSAGSVQCNSLRAHNSVLGGFYLDTSNDALGSHFIGVTANANRSVTESNYNNNYSYSYHEIVGRYGHSPDMSDLSSVDVWLSSALSSRFPNASWTSATTGSTGWNGSNNAIRFNSLRISSSHNNEQIRVIGQDLDNRTYTGYATYINDASGEFTSIGINTGTNYPYSRTPISVYLHELGHVCGLEHPDGDFRIYDYSIMAVYGPPYETYYITDADRYNVLHNR